MKISANIKKAIISAVVSLVLVSGLIIFVSSYSKTNQTVAWHVIEHKN